LRAWGVCDSGAACASHPDAHFSIAGYLDAYHMRSVAMADLQRQALLYKGGRSQMIVLPTPRDPAAAADLILRNLGKVK
jgi:hypothetical protein